MWITNHPFLESDASDYVLVLPFSVVGHSPQLMNSTSNSFISAKEFNITHSQCNSVLHTHLGHCQSKLSVDKLSGIFAHLK